MKTDYSLNLKEKIELQDKLLQSFEDEKTRLLNTIESLNLESKMDKQLNTKSIELAKELTSTMEEQIKLLKKETENVQRLKEEYKKYVDIMHGLKDKYQQLLIDFSDQLSNIGNNTSNKQRCVFKKNK